MRRSSLAAIAATAVLAPTLSSLAQHHEIIGVGHEHDGRLGAHVGAMQPFPVDESIVPQLPGYATFDLAIESLMAEEGHLMPLTEGDIRLRLIAIDPGLSVYGNGPDPLPVGGEIVLGAPFFHVIPAWVIQPGPLGGLFGADLQLHDASGLHADSEVFRLTFTAVPAPGVAPLVFFGAALLRRKR